MHYYCNSHPKIDIRTEECQLVCFMDGKFDELFLRNALAGADPEGHLQVRNICKWPALDRERNCEPEGRGQRHLWSLWQQIQVCHLKRLFVSQSVLIIFGLTWHLNLHHCLFTGWTMRSLWSVRRVWTTMARRRCLRPWFCWMESWLTSGLRNAPTWSWPPLKSL